MDQEVLSFLCDAIEQSLGLKESSGKGLIRDQKITDLMKLVNGKSYSLPKETTSSLVTHIALLAYMTERAIVRDTIVLDYEGFQKRTEIDNIIGIVNSKSDLDKRTLKRMDALVSILYNIERKSLDKRFTVEFRLLVLYLVCVSKSLVVEAKIIARLVQNQLGRC